MANYCQCCSTPRCACAEGESREWDTTRVRELAWGQRSKYPRVLRRQKAFVSILAPLHSRSVWDGDLCKRVFLGVLSSASTACPGTGRDVHSSSSHGGPRGSGERATGWTGLLFAGREREVRNIHSVLTLLKRSAFACYYVQMQCMYIMHCISTTSYVLATSCHASARQPHTFLFYPPPPPSQT